MIEKLRSLLKSQKYARNTLWALLEKVITMGAVLVAAIWVARFLGPERYGVLGYSQGIVAILLHLTSLGLDNLIVRFLLDKKWPDGKIMSSLVILRSASALFSIVLLVCATYVFSDLAEIRGILIICSIACTGKIFDVYRAVFQANVDIGVLARYSMVHGLVILSVKLLAVYLVAPLWVFALIVSLDPLIASLFIRGLGVRKYQSYKLLPADRKCMNTLLHSGWPLLLSGFATVLYMRSDQMMLKSMIGFEATGLYISAIRLSDPWNIVAISICQALFPALAKGKELGEEEYLTRVVRLFQGLIALSFVIAVAVFVFADWLVLLLFGDAFTESASILKVHIWSIIAIYIGLAFNQYLILQGRQRLILSRSILGLVLNVSLNLYLIPRYGAVAAAWSTLLSQMILNTIALSFCKEGRTILKLLLVSRGRKPSTLE